MSEHANMLELNTGRTVVEEIAFEHKDKGVPCRRDIQFEMPILDELHIKVVNGSACYNRSLDSFPLTRYYFNTGCVMLDKRNLL